MREPQWRQEGNQALQQRWWRVIFCGRHPPGTEPATLRSHGHRGDDLATGADATCGQDRRVAGHGDDLWHQ